MSQTMKIAELSGYADGTPAAIAGRVFTGANRQRWESTVRQKNDGSGTFKTLFFVVDDGSGERMAVDWMSPTVDVLEEGQLVVVDATPKGGGRLDSWNGKRRIKAQGEWVQVGDVTAALATGDGGQTVGQPAPPSQSQAPTPDPPWVNTPPMPVDNRPQLGAPVAPPGKMTVKQANNFLQDQFRKLRTYLDCTDASAQKMAVTLLISRLRGDLVDDRLQSDVPVEQALAEHTGEEDLQF